MLSHPEAFRAVAIAQTLHTPAKEMAKIVIVKVDEQFVMTVLPASLQVDLHRLKDVFMTSHVGLATEGEFKDLFPDCELGAMPPFGILDGLPVFVDHSLTEDDTIVFQSRDPFGSDPYALHGLRRTRISSGRKNSPLGPSRRSGKAPHLAKGLA